MNSDRPLQVPDDEDDDGSQAAQGHQHSGHHHQGDGDIAVGTCVASVTAGAGPIARLTCRHMYIESYHAIPYSSAH